MKAYPLSFENTEHAFAYKTTKELKKARLLFFTMGYRWIVQLGILMTPWALKIGLPVKGLIRRTIYDQFVGGETLMETASVARRLEKYQVKVILDYGVEGKEEESTFDHSCEEFVRVVQYAATQASIPFISIKVTGFARFSLLEKLDKASSGKEGSRGIVRLEVLNAEEKAEWWRVVDRMEKIMDVAAQGKVSVLVDAEESWIQDPVDALTMQMMEKYNGSRAVVYNTIQLYRADRLQFLKDSFEASVSKSFLPAVKLVRGAYMEKERKRAAAFNYPSPIQSGKIDCDADYNEAIQFAVSNIEHLAVVIASHNEKSNQMATDWIDASSVAHDHPHIHFSQLFGMSDNITFNLARSGYSVSKYLPFGPIHDVIPYLMRRASENSSVSGQTGKELSLINKEITRRKGQ